MPNEEKMTMNERRKYLRLIKKRHVKASKLERGRLLDEMEAITGRRRELASGATAPTRPVTGRCLPLPAGRSPQRAGRTGRRYGQRSNPH